MKETTKLLYELAHLSAIKHEGWRLAGVQSPKSVAEHALHAAQIGYFLAKKEGVDPFRVCTMLVFHDMGECRVGDIHKVANRYVEVREDQAIQEQLAPLEKEIKEELWGLWTDFETRESLEGKVAKDADRLEVAFTAKELMDRGLHAAEDWLRNVGPLLYTSSARTLYEELQQVSSTAWWRGLKKL